MNEASLDNIFKLVLDSFENFSLLVLVKILFLIALLIYLAFAGIVIRQVDLMNRTLKSEFGLPLKLIAWVHLWVALMIFLLALIIL